MSKNKSRLPPEDHLEVYYDGSKYWWRRNQADGSFNCRRNDGPSDIDIDWTTGEAVKSWNPAGFSR